MDSLGRKLTLLTVFALLAATVFSLGYTYWLRKQMVPEIFAFIPAESNLVFASGDIASVWDGMDFHFGKVIRESADQGETLAEPGPDALPELPGDGLPAVTLEQGFGPGEETGVEADSGVQQDATDEMLLEEPVLVRGGETEENQGFLTETIGNVQLNLLEKGVPVESKDDLRDKYGIDISRGILAGFSPLMTSASTGDEISQMAFTILIPVPKSMPDSAAPQTSITAEPSGQDPDTYAKSPQEKLTAFLTALFDIETFEKPCGDTVGSEQNAIGLGEGFVLSFPSEGIAMLNSSCAQFMSSIGDQERNLKYALQDDWLFESAHRQLRRPLLTGSGLLLVLRGLALDFAPVLRFAIAVNFTPDAVLADVGLEVEYAQTRVVRNLLSSPIPERNWRHLLSRDTAVVLHSRDRYIPDYLELASYNSGAQRSITELYGGILDRIRRFEQTDHMLLAAEDYQDEIPLLLLGAWGPNSVLSEQLLETQKHLRRTRDMDVLSEAARVWTEELGGELPSIDELIGSQYLASDSRCGRDDLDWLSGWSVQEEEPEQTRVFSSEDFEGPDYLRSYRNLPIRYLDPCVTINDMKFRIDSGPDDVAQDAGHLSTLSPVEELLLENRYRMAATFLDDSLWIASTDNQIEKLIDRSLAGGGTTGFQIGSRDDASKLNLFINIPSLIERGLLSGDSVFQEVTESVLLDFRYHTAMSISLRPERWGRSIGLGVQVLGPDQVPQP